MLETVKYKDIAATISQHRGELMGVAILWVMIYHSYYNIHFPPLDFFRSIGFCGVDIFLFLSSFGLYYALKKNSNLSAFYKRRVKRIIPVYWIALIMLCLLSYIGIINDFSIEDTLMAALGLDFLCACQTRYTLWYIPSILIFYLCFPFLYKQIVKSASKTFIFIVFTTIIMSFIYYVVRMSISSNGIQFLLVARFPIFLLGGVFAHVAEENRLIRRTCINIYSIIALIFVILMAVMQRMVPLEVLKTSGLYFLPPFIFTPALVYSLAVVFDRTYVFIRNMFSFLGSISLELYISHVIIFQILLPYRINVLPALLWIVIIMILSILSAYILQLSSSKVMKLLL